MPPYTYPRTRSQTRSHTRSTTPPSQYSRYSDYRPSPAPTSASSLLPTPPQTFLPTLAIPPTLASSPEFPRFPTLVESYHALGGVPVPTPSDTLLQVYQFTQAVGVSRHSTAEELMAAEVLKLGVVYAQSGYHLCEGLPAHVQARSRPTHKKPSPQPKRVSSSASPPPTRSSMRFVQTWSTCAGT